MGFWSRVAGFFRASGWSATRTNSREVVAPSVLHHGRIGGGLTPEDVSDIMIAADQGNPQRLIDLFDESRQKDGHLQSICATRENEVAGLEFQVTAASPSRQDKKIAAWVSEWMQALGSTDLGPRPSDVGALVTHLQSAIFIGHAVAAVRYERDGVYDVPRAIEPIHARRFIFDELGVLRHWDADQPSGSVPWPGIDLLATYPGRVIQYQPRVTGATSAREGLLRMLVWMALFRNWDVRDWLQLAELAWKPYRYAQFTKASAGVSDRDIAERLRQLTSQGFAVFPDCVELTIEWAKQTGSGSGPGHAELCGFLAGEMSKGVLGATLAVDQGRVGSQALGNVHERRLQAWVKKDAKDISGLVRRQLIGPAVKHNSGRDAAVPQFQILTDDAQDFEATTRGFLNLNNCGVRVAARDVRDKCGLSEPMPGEEIVGKNEAQPGAPLLAQQAGTTTASPANA